ncbi:MULTISPECIES: universal stress protein [Pontibacillus]|uniref:Universal stress protein n=1 Tax=Pontibacillus chungwhensis TaxID=265426 RepID=A0ABY8V4M1_9BACI|nr:MULTISPECIES: universal stress protein [Pontibacillus]MCD5322240.1 universal stress protein [Pontibacillus sp. HN14]WIF99534.1 universal stress protein [Pontibacillus chungwhensis]
MYKRILLATDGSEHSVRSAKHASALANQFGGTVDIVFVIDGNKSKEDVLHNMTEYEIDLKRKEKTRAVQEVLEQEGVSFETNILHGEPGPTIVNFANDNNYDCVVIGSRGHNALQEMILGSVSHKVVKRVDAPVMVIK